MASATADAAAEPASPVLRCWNCNASLEALPRPITRHMNCPQCFEDLHCCRLCRHFIDNATNPCADDRAEPPVHKEGANFCDFFRPAFGSYRAGANERQAQAKSRLGALFAEPAGESEGEPKDDAPATPEDDARRRLDELFR